MDFQNRIGIYVMKARHSFENQDYLMAYQSLEDCITCTGYYFDELPNYYQVSEKSKVLIFVSDIEAMKALALLYMERFQEALDTINVAISYCPELLYYYIRCSILACNNELLYAVQKVAHSSSILNRAFLGNQCTIEQHQVISFDLLISIQTQDYYKTYSLLAELLQEEQPTQLGYLAIMETMRVAQEQVHQTPIELKSQKRLLYPGINVSNQLFSFEKLEYHAFEKCKELYNSAYIEELGRVRSNFQIVLMCFPEFKQFHVGNFDCYLDDQLFKHFFFKKHARLSREFMGMVKLAGIKTIETDELIITERDLREYLWDEVASKYIVFSMSRAHSVTSKSSSFSQANEQLERQNNEMKRRRIEYLRPIVLFFNKSTVTEDRFEQSNNIEALTNKDSCILRPNYHINSTLNKSEYKIGNGKFNTTTSTINKNKVDLNQQSVLKLYDRLPSNETTEKVKTSKNEQFMQPNKQYVCDMCNLCPNAIVENLNKYEIQESLDEKQRQIETVVESELLSYHEARGKLRNHKLKQYEHENETFRRKRTLEHQQQEDALLNSYKQKLGDSQLLLTNYDEFENVLYVHDEPRPKLIEYDENFNDLFKYPVNFLKKEGSQLKFKLSNFSKIDELIEQRDEQDNNTNTIDRLLNGQDLRVEMKLSDIEAFKLSEQNTGSTSNAEKVKKKQRPEIVIPTQLKLQFDAEVQRNKSIFNECIKENGEIRTKKYEPEETPDIFMQEYYRTKSTSFLFEVK